MATPGGAVNPKKKSPTPSSAPNPYGSGGGSWNGPDAALYGMNYSVLDPQQDDPYGLATLFPADSIGAPTPIGTLRDDVANMTMAQRQTLYGLLVQARVVASPKKNPSILEVENALTDAIRDAGQAGAGSLSRYINEQIQSRTQSGQPGTTGTGGTKVIPAQKVDYTVYSAADIQDTVDATAQKLIGRKATADELNAILGTMNSASQAEGAAKGQADLSVQQQNVASQTAAYGGNVTQTTAGRVSPQQVYQEVIRQGGSVTQAGVAAALVSGIESNGDPTELALGQGPAAGLFQFEPGTWLDNGGGQFAKTQANGISGAVAASWQQQVTVFINATKGDHFAPWGPDVAANRGDPNSASNPAYGYSGAPQQGSVVANWLAANAPSLGGGATGADISATGTGGSQGQTTLDYQQPVLAGIPNVPSANESAANFFETQRSPEYQANNLLNIFDAIANKLGAGSTRSSEHVLSGPVTMK